MPPIRTRARARRAEPEAPAPADSLSLPVYNGVPVGLGPGESERLARPLTLPGVTFEAAAYTILFLIGTLLRCWRVGDTPLSPSETQAAVAALEMAPGTMPPLDIGALLFFGTAFVFAIADGTDTTARLLPAIFGSLAPLTMLWARPVIGRGPAIIAATLLTVSPLLLGQSRYLDESAMAATLSLALVVAIFRYARGRRPGTLDAAAILLGLTLTAGTAAYSALIALAIFGIAALISRSTREPLPGDTSSALQSIAPVNGHVASEDDADARLAADAAARAKVLRAAALGAGTFVVVATGAFVNLNGIYFGVFAPLGAWLSAFGPIATEPFWWGPLTLLVYEPFALLLGVLGALAYGRRGSSFERFTSLWLLVALAATLVARTESASLATAAVPPATLLASILVHRLISRPSPASWRAYLIALASLGWAGALFVIGFGQASLVDPIGIRYIANALDGLFDQSIASPLAVRLVIVLPIVLLAGTLVALWRREDDRRHVALGLAAATLLFLVSIHAGWNLAFQATGQTSELPRIRQSSVDIRNLAEDVNSAYQVLTIRRTRERSLVIAESLRHPLSWNVRDLDARFDQAPATGPAMIILPGGAEPPGGRYAGQPYRLTAEGTIEFENLAEFWRWLVYRESPASPQQQNALLFVRSQ